MTRAPSPTRSDVATDTRSAHPPSAAPPAEPPPGVDALLVRANKLDLLERLADDLAHEIKNPLHSMVINLEVLKRRVARVTGASDQDEVQRYIGVLGGELERVTRRIDLLLRLSRPGSGAETTTLNELVEELMELIQLEARHHEVSVDYLPGAAPARVHVQRDPARQVILNLVLDALEQCASGSTLRIAIHNGEGRSRVRVERRDGETPERAPGLRVEVARSVAGAIGGKVEDGAPVPEVAFSLPISGG
ncbi:MAG TPA: HAMP domain-containing sensor histidine kinase [Longimicrobiaceae bacterium]|nr:HAMP domain-containing sensor histidine kinase [Longimicrobiaceae bacterium]